MLCHANKWIWLSCRCFWQISIPHPCQSSPVALPSLSSTWFLFFNQKRCQRETLPLQDHSEQLLVLSHFWLWWQLIYLHLLSIYLLFSHLRCLSSADKLELIWSKPGVLGEKYLFKSRISIVSLVHLVPNARSFTSLAETRKVPEDQDSFQIRRQIVQNPSLLKKWLQGGGAGWGPIPNFLTKDYFRPKWERRQGTPI